MGTWDLPWTCLWRHLKPAVQIMTRKVQYLLLPQSWDINGSASTYVQDYLNFSFHGFPSPSSGSLSFTFFHADPGLVWLNEELKDCTFWVDVNAHFFCKAPQENVRHQYRSKQQKHRRNTVSYTGSSQAILRNLLNILRPPQNILTGKKEIRNKQDGSWGTK